LYATDKVTVDDVDISINTSGNYFLPFNNRFSPFAAKHIDNKIKLTYEEKQ
jgi:hypothetical protein